MPQWIVDFPPDMAERSACLYEAPFRYVETHVKPERLTNNRAAYRQRWWIHGEPRPEMRQSLEGHDRYVVTTRHSKYRLFIWEPRATLPDSALIVFARHDDYFFGVLQSHAHEAWSLRMGTQVREASSGFRYTPTTCFETFPLPWPPGTKPENDPLYLAIAEAARELNTYREGWLNPPQVDGLPLPASELEKRTLTNLYNLNPTWLQNANRTLNDAVLAAYDRVTIPT